MLSSLKKLWFSLKNKDISDPKPLNGTVCHHRLSALKVWIEVSSVRPHEGVISHPVGFVLSELLEIELHQRTYFYALTFVRQCPLTISKFIWDLKRVITHSWVKTRFYHPACHRVWILSDNLIARNFIYGTEDSSQMSVPCSTYSSQYILEANFTLFKKKTLKVDTLQLTLKNDGNKLW